MRAVLSLLKCSESAFSHDLLQPASFFSFFSSDLCAANRIKSSPRSSSCIIHASPPRCSILPRQLHGIAPRQSFGNVGLYAHRQLQVLLLLRQKVEFSSRNTQKHAHLHFLRRNVTQKQYILSHFSFGSKSACEEQRCPLPRLIFVTICTAYTLSRLFTFALSQPTLASDGRYEHPPGSLAACSHWHLKALAMLQVCATQLCELFYRSCCRSSSIKLWLRIPGLLTLVRPCFNGESTSIPPFFNLPLDPIRPRLFRFSAILNSCLYSIAPPHVFKKELDARGWAVRGEGEGVVVDADEARRALRLSAGP